MYVYLNNLKFLLSIYSFITKYYLTRLTSFVEKIFWITFLMAKMSITIYLLLVAQTKTLGKPVNRGHCFSEYFFLMLKEVSNFFKLLHLTL